LDQNEQYLPSDLQTHINSINTIPDLNFTPITTGPSPLLLSNLDQLNVPGCTFQECPVFLTVVGNVTENPPFLFGTLPDPITGETVGAKSCAIVILDHGNGTMDAVYNYFYSFNQGPFIAPVNQFTGDHVGDWEQTAVRFQNELPVSVWLSQHGVSFLLREVVEFFPILINAVWSSICI